MSKIAIAGNPSGSATFTLEAPATDTDRTLVLPDNAGTVLTSASDIEAQVKTATNASGSAPIYACRAWVNFDGTTATPSTIRASGNVSSVTRNDTGDYTVNFTTAMPDANYAAIAQAGNVATANNQSATTASNIYSTSSFRFSSFNINGARVNYEALSVNILR